MATKLNLTPEKGAPYVKRLIWRNRAKRPIDLTGYSAVLEVRASIADPAVLLTLSTDNGKIALGGTSGAIALNFSEIDIASLPATSVYKLAVTPAGGVKKFLLEGKITISPWG